MPAARKNRKKTAFVPRVIFQAVAASAVVPLCAACGGKTLGASVAELCFTDAGDACRSTDASDDHFAWTVAAECFQDEGCFVPEAGVADGAADDVAYTVAAHCFDGGHECFGVADAGFSDARLGVAVDAFAGDAGTSKH